MPNLPPDPALTRLVAAALDNVVFDGWSPATFDAAVAATGMRSDHARTLAPRGALDLACAYHRQGDAALREVLRTADFGGMGFTAKVTFAVRARIAAITDKEAVRRGTALFALPQHAADGAKLLWGTADAIWNGVGDTADDYNWYTKRATLAGVYGASVLYWLGDDSLGAQATHDFIDRRIADVIRIEKLKAQVNGNALLRPVTAPLLQLLGRIKPPVRMPDIDLPGRWTAPE